MNPTPLLLQGRVAIVTGAGAGIGRGIALALAAAGAQVVVAARRSQTGDETVAMIEAEGGSAFSIQTDVADRAQVKAMVVATLERYGRIDIAVHNASSGRSGHPARLAEIDDDAWREQSGVALGGARNLAVEAFDALRASGVGRIVLLGSAFGLHGAAMNPVYAALKGAERGLTKSLAREWGRFGITVNMICPAAATEPTEVFFAQNPALKQAFLANFPLGRMGRPREDIGMAVVSICGDGFGYVTAQSIQVDGGLYTAV